MSYVEDHWSLKVWPPGFAAYYWYLTFADAALSDMAAACQQHLDTFHLNHVPPSGLHLTLVKVGAADTVGPSELSAFIAAAERTLADVERFPLEIGPLTGSASAIRFSVAPWDRLVDLHASLRESVISLRPTSPPKPTSHFRPHLGIAYHNQRREAAHIIKDVAALRDIQPVTVSVDTVKLVRLWRSDHQYRWDECAAIALR